MAEAKDSCVQPAGGPIGAKDSPASALIDQQVREEETIVVAQVGKPAPDFESSAFIDGGFKNIKLSDYKGEWVLLCFYPGDFTFV